MGQACLTASTPQNGGSCCTVHAIIVREQTITIDPYTDLIEQLTLKFKKMRSPGASLMVIEWGPGSSHPHVPFPMPV
jgi:hypothetical protein